MHTTKTRRPKFTADEDLQLVRMKLAGWNYKNIAQAIPLRTPKSLERRYHRLNESGEGAALRDYLTDKRGTTQGQG